VKHLAELHGGTVAVASEGEGKGSTFTVELPLTAQEPTQDVAASGVNADSATEENPKFCH
jgi:hypothetical protein